MNLPYVSVYEKDGNGEEPLFIYQGIPPAVGEEMVFWEDWLGGRCKEIVCIVTERTRWSISRHHGMTVIKLHSFEVEVELISAQHGGPGEDGGKT